MQTRIKADHKNQRHENLNIPPTHILLSSSISTSSKSKFQWNHNRDWKSPALTPRPGCYADKRDKICGLPYRAPQPRPFCIKRTAGPSSRYIVHKEHITRSPSNQSSESSGRMCSIYRTLYRCLISHSARRTRTNDQPGKNTFYFSSFIPTASRGGCVLCACAPVVAPAREFLRSDVRAKTRK